MGGVDDCSAGASAAGAGVRAPVGETLDGVAELVGVTAPETAQAGDPLSVRLVWRGAGEMTASYQRFVQLLGADGRPWAQADGVPVSGSRPTSGWLPGEYLVDELTIDLPLELPPGEYTVDRRIVHW
jgi:hypothetical protein